MAIIAVFNPGAGIGAATTALNLLAAIAQRGQRPLAVDLDPEAALSRVLVARTRRAEDSVCGFFLQHTPLADIAEITRSGIVLCPAHPDLAGVDRLLGRGLDAITRLRRGLRPPGIATGPVVIACACPLDVLALNAIFACDLMLVPVDGEERSQRGAGEVERALNALDPVHKRRLPRRYVFSGDAGEAVGEDLAARVAPALRPGEICATRIRADAALVQGAAAPADPVWHPPGSGGAQDYGALFDELRSLL